jgi:hypothetical protein
MVWQQTGLAESCGRAGKRRPRRTASRLYCATELEHALALGFPGFALKSRQISRKVSALSLSHASAILDVAARHRELLTA